MRPARDYGLAAEALFFVAAVRIALTVLPFRFVLAAAHRFGRTSSAVVSPERIAWAVGAASRRTPGTHCLTSSLAGMMMFARYGHPATFRLGMREDCTAHAWVECRGRAILGAAEGVRAME